MYSALEKKIPVCVRVTCAIGIYATGTCAIGTCATGSSPDKSGFMI